MKKIFTVFLMFFYMVSAIGITFSLHYCGGHYKQICFTADTEKGCCEDNEHKSNCCEDKVISAKFKDNHTSLSKTILSKIFFVDVPLKHSLVPLPAIVYGGYKTCLVNDSSPPILSDVPIYLMNRVLRV